LIEQGGCCAKTLFGLHWTLTGWILMRLAGRKTAQERFCSSLGVPHSVRY